MAEPTARRAVDREAAVVEAFVHLADTLVDDYDVIDFLHVLTDRCVALVDVTEAGVMLAAPSGHLQAVAASSERTHLLELYELHARDGPCLDAFRTGQVVASAQLDGDRDRWPAFAARAVAMGFGSVQSIPLRLRADVIGALDLLRADVGELPADDAKLARALADIATIGVLQARAIADSRSTARGLQTALDSRIRVEQAKGVLAERAATSVDEAFERMRAFARRNRLGITAVADRVIDGSLAVEP